VNSNYVLEPSNVTMAEILHDHGYTTAAFIANGLAGKKYQMNQGFEEHFESNRASAPEMAEAAVAFIKRQSSSNKPFFAYMHFLDVHDPHRIPPDRLNKFADPSAFVFDMSDTLLQETFVMEAWWSTTQKWLDDPAHASEVGSYFKDYSDLYDSSIAYWDESAGTILETLAANGLASSTIVIITSDHGEQLLEHGYFGHANSGYDVGLHIPLIIWDPGTDGGSRIDQAVSLVDVLPTVLNRVGIPVPSQVHGRSLWPFADPSTDLSDREKNHPVYTEGTFFSNRPVSTLIQSYMEGDWKLILDRLRDSKELYNLAEDPGETRDLFDSEPEVTSRLHAGLRQLYNENLRIFNDRKRSPIEQVDEKLKELQSLGYVTAAEPGQQQRQYYPMTAVGLSRFGPFGDEKDLERFADHIDFSQRIPIAFGQIVRGCNQDPRLADSTGVWFDRRSTFLMHNDGDRRRIVFEVRVDPGQPVRPTQIQIEFNDIPGKVFPIEGSGDHRVESPLPTSLQKKGYFYTGLLADSRFLLRAGASPRRHKYGAIKIRSISLR